MQTKHLRYQLLSKEVRNVLTIWLLKALEPIKARYSNADIAFMFVEHPVILPFMVRLRSKLGLQMDFVKPSGDFSKYRKTIVPNGLWPSVRKAAASIPEAKKVYCEIGFLPQTKNVYFDARGVHGHSSIRQQQLAPLSKSQSEDIARFKKHYGNQNFVRVKWDSINIEKPVETSASAAGFSTPFVFVPLQLETDTAFALCPFDRNQQIIDYVEETLPHLHIVFKMHPLDKNPPYSVSRSNTLLETDNTQLRKLITECDFLVASNSTVILEALVFNKKCATFGIGLTTNHNVTLECHDDLDRLQQISDWQPEQERIDSFLHLLLSAQVSTDFHLNSEETERAIAILGRHGLLW
tara:strand:+ start:29242 stop:30297 length:1056 start_codon:yes stop_codon:yes gene_type:complete